MMDNSKSKFSSSALTIEQIKPQAARSWILERHYAARMPQIEFCYGLFSDGFLAGVCSFGTGGNRNNNSLGKYRMIELNRLVVDDGMVKNSSSWFVSRCLKSLPAPIAVISYADHDFGHVGYIYQATNWIYTGTSEGKRFYLKDGKEYHRKAVYNMLGKHSIQDAKIKGFEYKKGKPKHRYFMFLGSKSDRKSMNASLKFERMLYPKGETARFENVVEHVTRQPDMQMDLLDPLYEVAITKVEDKIIKGLQNNA